jgi:hypothetical protein
VLIPDDGRKAEICSKFMANIVSVQIILLTEPNNKKIMDFIIYLQSTDGQCDRNIYLITTWPFIPFQLCNSNFNLKMARIRY